MRVVLKYRNTNYVEIDKDVVRQLNIIKKDNETYSDIIRKMMEKNVKQ